MQIGTYPCIEHFQSNNRCAQPGTRKNVGPKRTYVGHPETFFDETKGDPYWKHCSGHNRIGPKEQKIIYIGEPEHMVAPLPVP